MESVVVNVVGELRGVTVEGPALAFDLVFPFEVVGGGFELGEVDQGVLESENLLIFTGGDVVVFEKKVDRCVGFQKLIEF